MLRFLLAPQCVAAAYDTTAVLQRSEQLHCKMQTLVKDLHHNIPRHIRNRAVSLLDKHAQAL